METDLKITVRCTAERIATTALRAIYGFDSWHCDGTFNCRAYKRRAVDLVNALRPETVLEIGCGLGDIVCRLDAPTKIGVDADKRVIAAARAIRGRSVKFEEGSLSEAAHVGALVGGKADIVLMLNWCHLLTTAELREQLVNLLAYLHVNFVLIDTIDRRHARYAHHHDVSDLEDIGSVFKTVDGGDDIRRLHILQIVHPDIAPLEACGGARGAS